MTEQIANLLVEELQVKGAAVIIEAEQTCMTYGRAEARLGLRHLGHEGYFRMGSSTRAELMTLIYGDRQVGRGFCRKGPK